MRPALPNLRDQANGRWRSILPRLGASLELLDGKQHGCPTCGGKDRFRFDDKNGDGCWYCNVCGAGDGAKLAMAITGLSFAEMATRVRETLPDCPIGVSRLPRNDAHCRDAARALWLSAGPIAGTMAEDYLRSRRCWTPAIQRSPELRFAGRVLPGDTLPAMLALVRDAQGVPVNVHRTYLDDARRAERKMMPGAIPNGAAIRLMPATGRLGVAEGIETAILAAERFGVPSWSTISAGGLEKWTPPPGVTSVDIFGDSDRSFAGQASAFILARKLTNRRDQIACTVRLPETIGTDWADADPMLERVV